MNALSNSDGCAEVFILLGELSREPNATCNLSPSRSLACGLATEGNHSIDDIADDPYDLVPYIDLVSCRTNL